MPFHEEGHRILIPGGANLRLGRVDAKVAHRGALITAVIESGSGIPKRLPFFRRLFIARPCYEKTRLVFCYPLVSTPAGICRRANRQKRMMSRVHEREVVLLLVQAFPQDRVLVDGEDLDVS